MTASCNHMKRTTIWSNTCYTSSDELVYKEWRNARFLQTIFCCKTVGIVVVMALLERRHLWVMVEVQPEWLDVRSGG